MSTIPPISTKGTITSNHWWSQIPPIHYCLKVNVRFVDIRLIVDHHCLDVIIRFVDIGGIVDHHCLKVTSK
jgi:hypothetical protein